MFDEVFALTEEFRCSQCCQEACGGNLKPPDK